MLEMNQIFNKLATETVLKQSKATNSIEIHPPFRYLFFFFFLLNLCCHIFSSPSVET